MLTADHCAAVACARADAISFASEYQTDARAATLAVVERERPAVVFHDLLDDREPQTRAFAARGHVGLGEPLAVLGWQALAIVLDENAHVGPVVAQAEHDLALRQALAC